MGSRITGIGSHLPERCVTNADLEKMVDTSDEWIVQRTGIHSRHLLGDDDTPSDMGTEALKKALDDANVDAADIDLLIVATNFPDMICPGTAPFIAEALGMEQAAFFDVKAGCTGFVYALAVADGMIKAGLFNRAAVVGIEALSRVTDWTDRKTCVLFGDGAGAAIVEPGSEGEGVVGVSLRGDPSKNLLLHLPAGGTRTPASSASIEAGEHFLRMEGSGVFRHAVPMMERAARSALEQAGLALSDIDWVIPHQANLRIIDALVRRLRISADKVIVNLDRVANTSTASIPIALDEAVRDGRVNAGDVVVMTAFGAGVTYGAIAIRV